MGQREEPVKDAVTAMSDAIWTIGFFSEWREYESMAEAQNDPLLPGYSFNAHLVAGLTPIEANGYLDFLSTDRWE